MRNSRVKAVHIIILLLLAFLMLTDPVKSTDDNSTNKINTAAGSSVLKNLTIGYLTAARGNLDNRQGLSISGAITLALKEIEDDPDLLPNVSLVLRWDDTQGDTVHATKTITQMICDKVAVFFGPEGNTCHTEAIVAQAWNIPMISYNRDVDASI